MSDQYAVTVIGGLIAFLQALMLAYLVGIKSDISDVWKRLYSHYHEIECENDACKKVKTGNVIVPHERA